jgi:hypothetical protein
VDLPHVSRRRRRGAEAVARADDEGAGGLGAGEGTEIGLVWFGLGVGGVGNRRTVGRLLHVRSNGARSACRKRKVGPGFGSQLVPPFNVVSQEIRNE